jgi:hypothetical protein
MTATTSRKLPGNSRTGRDGVLEILVPMAADAQTAPIRVRASRATAVPVPRLTPEKG